MAKNQKIFKKFLFVALIGVFVLSSCAPEVACPTGHQDAKKMFLGAENGRGTEKERTDNGLIKKKKQTKRHKK